MNIYLAGDSIVQNYTDEEFIAGWGQYLPYYVNKDARVINYAKGGRSSRLFINEGRFDELEKNIKAGDYLLIEMASILTVFCCAYTPPARRSSMHIQITTILYCFITFKYN